MWQMYSCPHCRAPVACVARFCSNCGVNLAQKILSQPLRLACCYQCSNTPQTGEQRQPAYHQQSEWRQQSGQNQPPPDNEAAMLGTPVKCQQPDMHGSCGVHPQEKSYSVDGTMTPMRAEISKLLEGLFDRRINRSS